MGENQDDNDPFEEDIVFDQTGLLGRKPLHQMHHQPPSASLPTFLLFIRIAFLCIIFIGLGLCVAVSQGPLVNLEVTLGISSYRAFHIFTAYSLGMLIGGLLGSALFEVYNRQFLIFISLLWVSACMIVLPFTITVSYWWTLITLTALGSGLAFIFTGSNVLILDLLGRQRGSGMQCLHFCFAIGALIAALSIHPFLSGMSTLGLSPLNVSFVLTDTSTNPSELHRVPRSPDLEYKLNHTTIMPFINTTFLKEPTKYGDFAMNATHVKLTEQPDTNHTLSVTFSPNDNSSDDLPMTSEMPAKPPKPKPSFTNANLIPEPSKWKRPPQKEIQSSIKSNSTSVIAKEEGTSINSSTTTTLAPSSPSFSMRINQDNSSDIKSFEEAVTLNPTLAGEIHDALSSNHPTIKEVNNSFSLIKQDKNETFDNLTTTPSYIDLKPTKKTLNSIDASESTILKAINMSSITTSTSTTTVPPDDNIMNGEINRSTNSTAKPASIFTTEGISLVTPSSPIPHPVLVHFTTQKPKGQSEVLTTHGSIPVPKQILTGTVQPSFEIDFSDNIHDDYGFSNYDYHASYSQYVDSHSNNDNEISSVESEPELLDLKERLKNDGTKMVSPHLDDQSVTDIPKQTKPGTYSNFSEMNPHFLDTLTANFKNYGITGIHLFYIGIGVSIMILAFISVIFLCHKPREPRSKQEDGSLNRVHKAQLRIFILLFSLYMFSAEAVQGAIHHLLAASHTADGFPLFTKSVDGQAIFWGLISAVRFLCILIFGCFKIKPGKLLVLSTFLMVLGTILFCIGTFDKKDFLWGGIVIVGLGLAPILPTCFLWMAEFMKVTHQMCALMIVVSSFGNSLTHTTLTYVLANSHLYSYILIGISLSSVVFLTSTFCILFKNVKNKSLALPDGYQLANQDDEEGLELSRPHIKNYDHLSHHVNEMSEAGQALLID